MGLFSKVGGFIKARKDEAAELERVRLQKVADGEKLSLLEIEGAKHLSDQILEQEELVEVTLGNAGSDARLAPEVRGFLTRYEEVSFGEMSILLTSKFLDYDAPLPGMIVIGQNIDSQYVCIRPHEETVYYVWGPLTKDPQYVPETDRSVYHAVISAALDSGELPDELRAEIERVTGISA